jgi:hypothetical protein
MSFIGFSLVKIRAEVLKHTILMMLIYFKLEQNQFASCEVTVYAPEKLALIKETKLVNTV